MSSKNELHQKYSRLRGIFEEAERSLPNQMQKIARLMKAGAELDERPLTEIRKRYEGLMKQAELIESSIRVPVPDENKLVPLLDEAIELGGRILEQLRLFEASLDERLKAF